MRRVVEAPEYRYIFNMEVMDYSGSQYVQLFNDEGERFFEIPAGRMNELEKSNSEEYEKGVFARTDISVKAGEQTVVSFRKTGSYESTVDSLTIRLVSKAKGAYWVTVDGQPVPRTIVREVFDESPCAWYYNMSDRTIWVKYPKPAHDNYDVVISTEKFDLVGMVKEEE